MKASLASRNRFRFLGLDNFISNGIETIAKLYILYHTISMKFEYNTDKSLANKSKHGIDFDEAQALWDDANLLEIPAKGTDEPRYLVIGMIRDKHWSAIMTYRNQNIRLISVRRSRKEEVALYESI